jgi:pimeloyl-ACP methyl ester carboxylesterase
MTRSGSGCWPASPSPSGGCGWPGGGHCLAGRRRRPTAGTAARQGGWSGGSLPVIPDLVRTHRVVAPDRPGLGASETPGGPPDTATVLTWLDKLIYQTCAARRCWSGPRWGGSITARFAAAHSQRPARRVLVDIARDRQRLLAQALRL